MNTTTEHPAPAERPAQERQERKEPTYLFLEKYVRRFRDTRARLNTNVDKANNFLVKRFHKIDHNTYLEGALPAQTKELTGLVASACLGCDDCIFYHAIQAYRLGVTRAGRVAQRGTGWGREHCGSSPAARLRTARTDVRVNQRLQVCGCNHEITSVTMTSVSPAPSSTRCGLLKAAQAASGGQKILASRIASKHARTPERKPTAVATRRCFSGVMGCDPS